jgi:hypothetical protein
MTILLARVVCFLLVPVFRSPNGTFGSIQNHPFHLSLRALRRYYPLFHSRSNILVFSFLYCQIDLSGPEARLHHPQTLPDWLFPQAELSELMPGWLPNFVDYFVSALQHRNGLQSHRYRAPHHPRQSADFMSRGLHYR